MLGIVGGLGPESTLAYYSTIIALFRRRKPDGTYPDLLINSVDMKKALDFIEANDLASIGQFLLDAIGKLAQAGADFGLISANTPHIVFDQIAPRSPIPLISIVDSVCLAAKVQNLRKLLLFGTRFTMEADFYPKVFAREEIELTVPDAEDRDYIHDKYLNELVPGKFLPETRAGLLAIIDRMTNQIDIDGVILAGTELPLILSQETHKGIPLLDTVKIHCEAAVNEMFSCAS